MSGNIHIVPDSVFDVGYGWIRSRFRFFLVEFQLVFSKDVVHTTSHRIQSVVDTLCNESEEFPEKNIQGKEQTIKFPITDSVLLNTDPITLKASSSEGMQVSYFVKYGPAEIDKNQLHFTSIAINSL